MSASIPQIRCRMDSGHVEIIRTIEAGGLLPRCRSGWLRRLETLLGWQCVVVGRSGQYAVTNKGRQAVREYELSCGRTP